MTSSTTDYLQLDAEARERALALESFIVQAPAGAGKTELLTQRFLRLLPTVAQPEEIIAITFTNKAAAEMRVRILSSLEMAARGEWPAEAPHKQKTYRLAQAALEADQERGWGLLHHAGRLQVTTIDALCARLARQMPFLSRFGTQPLVCDDCTPHYEEAARATLELLEGGDENAEIVANSLDYFDNDQSRLLKLLVSMLSKRDQWGHRVISPQQAVVSTEAGLEKMVALELQAIAAFLDPILQSAIMPAVRYAASMACLNGQAPHIASLQHWTEPLHGTTNELVQWRGLAGLLLTSKGTLRKRLDPGLKLSTPEGKPHAAAILQCIESLGSDAEAALARLQILPDPLLEEDAGQVIGHFSTLLKLANAQLWLVFQAHGEVDFIGVAERALLALGEDDAPTPLRERLDARISHLLVDEFQDTSPNQVRLLEKLTSDWQADDGRTLFLVGDPMQSIYRFRKADVGLFLQAREQGIGHIAPLPLQLYRNNRSAEELVTWVNQTFPDIFASFDDIRRGRVAFSPASATHGSEPGAQVSVHPVINSNHFGEPAEVREAREILAILRAAQQTLPHGEKIAVLVRARSHLETLVAHIREHAPEIRYQAVEIEGLAERQVVQDLAALVRALYHRADRVNWLAILRAPWCGLTLADLHVLAADDHRSTLWLLMQDEARVSGMSEEGQQRLRHLRSCLAEAFSHQGRMRPKRWVEGVWQMLGGPHCLQSAADSLDAQAFLRLLEKLDRNGRLQLERLDEELAKLYAAPDPTAGDTIQFMTIHKSKGLEFDTVILPGLSGYPKGPDQSLLVWDEFMLEDGEEHLVAAPINKRGQDKDAPPSAYDYLCSLEKERASNESRRLLYVAVTRAKRHLHLLGSAKTVKDGGVGTPSSNSLLGLLWSNVEPLFKEAAAALGEPVAFAAPENTAKHFVPKLIRLDKPSMPSPMLGKMALPQETAEPIEDEGGGQLLEADIGTLTHRYLEWFASDGLDAWPFERIGALEATFQGWFLSQGHQPSEAEQAAARVRQYLEKTLSSETGRWVLGPHAQGDAEVAFTSGDETSSRTHIIDRTFMQDGVRWIIDYKTTLHTGEDLDAFLTQKAESHRDQLERYAGLFDVPVQKAIYFVAHQVLKKL